MILLAATGLMCRAAVEQVDTRGVFSMVHTAGMGKIQGKAIEVFVVAADGSYKDTLRVYGANPGTVVTDGKLTAEQVTALVKQVAAAKEGEKAEDAGTVVFKWRDKEGKEQERLYSMPGAEPAKGLMEMVQKMVKENAKEKERL